MKTPCLNNEIREAFILCGYTGLRWCDVKSLEWKHFKSNELVVLINQEKTLVEHKLELHEVAKAILDRRYNKFQTLPPQGKVFKLPSQDMALRLLDSWCRHAGINKHITWHSARLSFSILLQDARVDNATVALLLGQTSTKYVENTYKRFRLKSRAKRLQSFREISLCS